MPLIAKVSRYKIPRKGWAAGGGLLLTAALFLLAATYTPLPGDREALEGFQDNRSGWLDGAALAVSRLGEWKVSAILVLVSAAGLAALRLRVDAFVLVFSAVPCVVGFLLKDVVGRARPEYFLAGAEPGSLSFPSSHALFAMIFGGLLVLWTNELVAQKGIRRTMQVIVVLLVLAVGASRVYLGVHWPSDVVGGYLFGGMALIGLIGIRTRLINNRTKTSSATA